MLTCPASRPSSSSTTLGAARRAESRARSPGSELLAREPDPQVEPTAASDVLLLAYTSGTTGRPKGAVHTHAGFVTKTASEVAYGFEMAPGRTFCWITDMGWIMGPLSILGTHGTGGTLLLYEGSPDVPDTRPAVAARRAAPGHDARGQPRPSSARCAPPAPEPSHDLSSVRVLGSTGEPWDPESYEWLARDVFGGRVPVINFSGGTEVGGSFLCPYPVETIASCSLGGPALGMDVDVVDDHGAAGAGRDRRAGLPAALAVDDARDLERRRRARGTTRPTGRPSTGCGGTATTRWSTRHGSWFILGRSDDVMNVAGKRVAPAEIESVVAVDAAVAESAVVGIPDPTKGEAVWVFYVARRGADGRGRRRPRGVRGRWSPPRSASRSRRAGWCGWPQLPKTRSAKILRRAIRAAVLDADPGDLSRGGEPAGRRRHPGPGQGAAVSGRAELPSSDLDRGAVLDLHDRLGVRVHVPLHPADGRGGVALLIASVIVRWAWTVRPAHLGVDEALVVGRGVDGPRQAPA